MKKTLKIKKNFEFRKILTKGKYFSGKYIDSYISKSNANINYIGIAVGVKVAKAVKRNRIKRLILENYRLMEEKLEVGNRIVFLWKKKVDVKEATFEHIKEDMNYIFKKAGIIK